ncbi:MAG TPA: glycosyltransferase family 39 protein [Acidimicrobiales bacterium]|nr:glycosyltransferase family 39 protein [Acidimicrobiales bacterium]
MTTVVSEAPADVEPASVAPAPTIGGSMGRRRFGWALTAVVAVGLAVRVGYVLIFAQHVNNKVYDSFWYGVTANELKLGHFFALPFTNAPSAAHPPLTSILAGSVNFLIGLHAGTTFQRLVMAVLGTGAVLCVGLLGRSVAGPWVGLVAAGLAAVAPNFWIPSGIVMSEAPAMLFMALILLAVVRLIRSPTVLMAALLGAACGAEALVRAELLLFVPFLLVPAALLARSVPLRRRFGLMAVGIL